MKQDVQHHLALYVANAPKVKVNVRKRIMNEKPWTSVLSMAAFLWANSGCVLFLNYTSVLAIMIPWLGALVVLLIVLAVVYRRENRTSGYTVAPVAKTLHLIFGVFIAVAIFVKGWSLFWNGYRIALLAFLPVVLFVAYALAAGYYACCDVARLRRGADEGPKSLLLK